MAPKAGQPLGQGTWTCSTIRSSALLATVRYVEEFGGALLAGLAAAIVASGGLDLRMAGELLHGAQVGTSVQEIADEGSPKVVRRERCHTGLDGSAASDVQHGLSRHPPRPQPPSFINGHEQRP